VWRLRIAEWRRWDDLRTAHAACRHCAVHRLYDRVAGAGSISTGQLLTADPPSAGLGEQLRSPFHRRARLESCLARQERRVLELGCGDGNFSLGARHGWEVTARNSAPTRRRCRSQTSHRSSVGGSGRHHPRILPRRRRVSRTEHVYHPAAWVRRVRGLVEPGGLLHLQVPNGASLTRQLTGRTWASSCFRSMWPHARDLIASRALRVLGPHSHHCGIRTVGTVSRSIYNLATR
jgi:hypothetical protein